GLLGSLASDFDTFPENICVFSAGWKQKRNCQDLFEYYHRIPCQRTVARRKLDLYLLGVPSWCGQCAREAVQITVEFSSYSHQMDVYVRICQCDLDLFPGRFHLSGLDCTETDPGIPKSEYQGFYAGSV